MRRAGSPRRPRAARTPYRQGLTRRVLALALVALALSACAPAAGWLRDQLDSGDAILAYAEGGVLFDPLTAPAYQVHVTLRGEGLELVRPEGPCSVSEDARYVDCSLGTVTSPALIEVHGHGVIGSATYTREPSGISWQWAYTPM